MSRIAPTLLLLMLLLSAVAAADIEATRAAATRALQEGQNVAAIGLLRELLEEAPDDGAAHFQLATTLLSEDATGAAATHFERARDIGVQVLAARFGLAQIHARAGRKGQALSELEGIAAAGFNRPQSMEAEADFDALAGDPRFQAALLQTRANRYPCNGDARAHAFDFWIGTWDVFVAGTLAGTNRIEAILGHCTLQENWSSASGLEGKSFNYYDPGFDHWRQIWIDDSGTRIEFVGAARDGGIYYTAQSRNPASGQVTQHKLEFTQNEDFSVRQHWQVSTDEGLNWTTVWDGRYVRTAD